MPDGSKFTRMVDVDRYYHLAEGVTSNRLHNGWTLEDCCRNKRGNKVTIKRVFSMPDGSEYNRACDVDRYHNLRPGRTSSRLSRGWTEEECAKNFRYNKVNREKIAETTRLKRNLVDCDKRFKHILNIPNKGVFRGLEYLDTLNGSRLGTSRNRIHDGWTKEECINNKRVKSGKRVFNMPDGSVLTYCRDVDRYYNLGLETTKNRLASGWTEQECANNKKRG